MITVNAIINGTREDIIAPGPGDQLDENCQPGTTGLPGLYLQYRDERPKP